MWDESVAPILDRNCFKCHAGVRQKSGLDLRSLDTILRGGDRGPAIIPGKPEESRIMEFILPGADPHMPSEGKQLPDNEVETLREWIRSLPRSKSNLASGTSTNITWVSGYLADLRNSEKPRFVPPASMATAQAIDAILKSDWKERKITPSAPCDDGTFARRAYLDIAGRIPTTEEMKFFLDGGESQKSTQAERRATLVDKLLASDDYPRHMRDIFDFVLMGRPRKNQEAGRREHGWFDFLEYSFRTNLPWNKLVRQIIVARGTNAPFQGANWYLYERKNNYQAMAEAIAPVVFGTQMKCAQCHNHPLAWEVEQRHYWGLVAAFNRSKNVDGAPGQISESAIGGFVQFANLKKESQPAVLTFLNGKTVDEKRPAESEKENDSPELYLVPPKEKAKIASVPRFSRREALADAVTKGNPLLARAFVNRMWEILMGQGIVHPVDQINSRYHASHPVLLDWLAADFENSNYDVKRLIRGIVLSRAYQLESKPSGRTAPPVNSFARALDKPLSAEQLLSSLLVATGNFPVPDGTAKVAGHEVRELHKEFVKRFPDFMPAVYNPSLEQALFWSNSPLLDDLLRPAPGNTASALLALDGVEARINKAFSIFLGRAPDGEEREKFRELLATQAPEMGIKNLLWTLAASAEFQLNH
jgi:hypothetical protein